jgi:uncharacterized protein Yka (UPF0111/DUF47 family)
MATMITEVYEAFKSAGAEDDKAKAAAQAVAEHESRFDKIDGELATVRAELSIIKWLVGGTFFATIALLLKSLIIG